MSNDKPVLISGMWVHKRRIYDEYDSNHFVATRAMIYRCNFYNGYELIINPGDQIYILLENEENKCYSWKYLVHVYRNGELVNYYGDNIDDVTYTIGDLDEYSFENVEYLIKNFYDQLTAEIPPLETIFENYKFPAVKEGDTLVSFNWDNGLLIHKVCTVLPNGKVNALEYNLGSRAGFYENHNNEYLASQYFLNRHYFPYDLNIDDLRSGKISYNDIIDQVLKDYSEFKRNRLIETYNKLKK